MEAQERKGCVHCISLPLRPSVLFLYVSVAVVLDTASQAETVLHRSQLSFISHHLESI